MPRADAFLVFAGIRVVEGGEGGDGAVPAHGGPRVVGAGGAGVAADEHAEVGAAAGDEAQDGAGGKVSLRLSFSLQTIEKVKG